MKFPAIGRDLTHRIPSRLRAFFWTLALTSALSLLTVAGGDAAAPHVIVVYGELLPRPVALAEWEEIEQWMEAIAREAEGSPGDLDRRRYLNLAFFFEDLGGGVLEEGASLTNLSLEDAGQHGRFYPASNGRAALVWLEAAPSSPSGLRHVAPEGVAILREHGVPVQVAEPFQSAISFVCLIAGGGWMIILGLALIWLRRSIRKSS